MIAKTASDITDSERFELADVLKEESEGQSAPRTLEDILMDTDEDFDPLSQRSCYSLLAAYIARPTATLKTGAHAQVCSNCGEPVPYYFRYPCYCPCCGATFVF